MSHTLIMTSTILLRTALIILYNDDGLRNWPFEQENLHIQECTSSRGNQLSHTCSTSYIC